jgi:hypothetical protein
MFYKLILIKIINLIKKLFLNILKKIYLYFFFLKYLIKIIILIYILNLFL